jgi:hypothetical protein
LEQFAGLFEFAGLRWNAQIEALARQQTSTSGSASLSNVHRVSRDQINRWRSEVTPELLAALRAGYCGLPLPWSQTPGAW